MVGMKRAVDGENIAADAAIDTSSVDDLEVTMIANFGKAEEFEVEGLMIFMLQYSGSYQFLTWLFWS